MAEIRDLVDYPQHVPIVSQWAWETWDRLRGWSLEQSLRETESWLRRGELPWGIVTLEGEKPAGCMALLAYDLSDNPEKEFGPWFACQYVAPEFRGADIAQSMAAALEERAAGLGYERFYMWTEHDPRIYRRFGWRDMFRTKEFGMDVTVMCKDRA